MDNDNIEIQNAQQTIELLKSYAWIKDNEPELRTKIAEAESK